MEDGEHQEHDGHWCVDTLPKAKCFLLSRHALQAQFNLIGAQPLLMEFAATVVAKVGPVQAKFNGNVMLTNLNPPESYTISGEGKGGAAGFAKGGADVRLLEEGEDTVLTYTAKADVGGKLAQLGSRLIDGTAKKMADEFFNNFSKQVAGPAPAPAPEAAPAPEEVPEAAPPTPAESLLHNKFVWAAAAIVILMIVVMLFR